MKTLLLIIFIITTSWANSSKPNVLFIAVDDLNDWIGVMKNHPDVKTPNIDALANSSMVFTNAHCQFPVCGPSRASVFSGYRPSTTGIYNNDKNSSDSGVQNMVKVRENRLIHEYMRDFGYKTLAVGKLMHKHVPDDSVDESGGRYRTPKKHKGRLNFDSKNTGTDWGVYEGQESEMADFRQADWAIERLKENHEKPFFLMLGLQLPHVPWIVPQKWWDLYDKDSLTLAPYLDTDFDDLPTHSIHTNILNFMPQTNSLKKEGKLRDATQSYLASISFIDHQIGRVLKTLESSEYRDNTIIIFWSDHGYHIGEKGTFQKHSLWKRASHVPLMISTPKMKQLTYCSKPVELLDLYPTLIDLCGLPKNTKNEGQSLKPLLNNPNADWNKVAITTYRKQEKHCKATGVPFIEEPSHGVFDSRYHYIMYSDGSEEFYDLENDPNEWHNLSSNPEHDSIKSRLRMYFKRQTSNP